MNPEENTNITAPEENGTTNITAPEKNLATAGSKPPALVKTEGKAKPKRNLKTVERPSRVPEDCYNDSPKKMTEKEKDAVILFFQKNMQGLYNQFEAYKQNTEGAFEQARRLQTENENLKRESKAKISLMKQNISMLYQNSILVNMED